MTSPSVKNFINNVSLTFSVINPSLQTSFSPPKMPRKQSANQRRKVQRKRRRQRNRRQNRNQPGAPGYDDQVEGIFEENQVEGEGEAQPEVQPPAEQCSVCAKDLCDCGNPRCKNGNVNLPYCDCTQLEKICNECMFNYSRNIAERCCGEPLCTHRTFPCHTCGNTQYYCTSSNTDVDMKLWGRKVVEVVNGQARAAISDDY